MMEGLALTGAWVDEEKGLLSMIVLEMGTSSRLCQLLKEGEEVLVMGPTGSPTEITENETVLLALNLPTGGATLDANSSAVLSIADDEAPAGGVLQFSAGSYSVNEGTATATITVTRTGGSSGAAAVTFSDAGTGSATAFPVSPR